MPTASPGFAAVSAIYPAHHSGVESKKRQSKFCLGIALEHQPLLPVLEVSRISLETTRMQAETAAGQRLQGEETPQHEMPSDASGQIRRPHKTTPKPDDVGGKSILPGHSMLLSNMGTNQALNGIEAVRGGDFALEKEKGRCSAPVQFLCARRFAVLKDIKSQSANHWQALQIQRSSAQESCMHAPDLI
jgi:hypothetical protein